MHGIGKLLILFGALLLGIGLLLQFGGRMPIIGRLPGDIRYEGEHFTFYVPIATCVLVSLVLTLLLNLFRRMGT